MKNQQIRQTHVLIFVFFKHCFSCPSGMSRSHIACHKGAIKFDKLGPACEIMLLLHQIVSKNYKKNYRHFYGPTETSVERFEFLWVEFEINLSNFRFSENLTFRCLMVLDDACQETRSVDRTPDRQPIEESSVCAWRAAICKQTGHF